MTGPGAQSLADAAPALRSASVSLVALRGAALVLLALDQTRRYLVSDVPDFASVPLVLTNLITQASIPILVFVEGVAAYARHRHTRTAGGMSRDLVVRGLLLILLELTVVRAVALFTILSFLDTTRFPPSLVFVLLSIGSASLVVAAVESRGRGAAALAVFGRVPLFFYLMQRLLAHTIAVGVTIASGRDTDYLFVTRPFSERPPPGTGFDLGVACACWLAALLLLYPLCDWAAKVTGKARAPRG